MADSKKTAGALLLVLAACCGAQEYRYQAFSRVGEPKLRGLKVGDAISEIVEGYGNAWCAWATSTLPAEGKAPERPKSFADPEDEWEYDARLSEWETMYAADRAFDGDTATAWCEGSPGDGVGEAVAVPVELTNSYMIFGGYGKSEDLWRKNARPKFVRLTLLEADPRTGAAQHAAVLRNLRAIGQTGALLADAYGFQPLDLPPCAYEEGSPHLLVIEIVSVYPGAKYADCLISEIRSSGQAAGAMGGFGPE